MKHHYYLAWQETDGRRSIAEQLDDARARSAARCGCAATVAYIGMGVPLPEGYALTVHRSSYCRNGILWVGIDELPERNKQWTPS